MAWKRIEDSELTSIADEIRTMAGTTNLMGLDEMKSKLIDTNSMIGEQASLIRQIQSVVDNLPDAEGDSGGLAIDTCTILVEGNYLNKYNGLYYTSYENGSMAYNYFEFPENSSSINNVVCNSIIILYTLSMNYTPLAGNGLSLLNVPTHVRAFRVTAAPGQTAVLQIIYNDF